MRNEKVRSSRVWIVLLLMLLCAGSGIAQDLPDATVGVPYNFDFGDGLSSFLGSFDGFTISLTYTAGGGLPPGLTLASSGLLSGTPTSAGQFNFTLNGLLEITFTQSGIPPFSIPFSEPFTMTVRPGTGPQISAQPSGLAFTVLQGGSSTQQTISLTNRSSPAVAFSATATGGSWLSVPSSGSAPAFGGTSLPVTVNPLGLAPGTYTGSVTIAGSFPGSPLRTVVVVIVSSSQPQMSLSANGLFFRTSSGGTTPPAQTFVVNNTGAGSLNWTATASTLSGGANWLSVSPASGSSSAATSPAVTVSVRPSGLAAGTYYGQVQVSAPGITNSPQTVSVVFNVLPASPSLDPDVRPTGLVFVGVQGSSANPAAQQVQLTNVASAPISYTTGISYEKGTGWLSVTPGAGNLPVSAPTSLAVSATTGTLPAGIYTAQLSTVFVQSNTTHRVSVIFIVLPAGATPPRSAAGCTPTKLLPVFSLLGQNFVSAASWPTSIEVTVVDDCGEKITAGSVVTSFSTSEEPISLTSLKDGRWSGTWTPRTVSSTPVSITATAQTTAPALSGTAQIGGSAQANPGVPQVNNGGVVNAASNSGRIPVAPGSMISIYGSGLGSGLSQATAFPLPTTLNGTQVLFAGKPLPLLFTSDGQINAVVPYDLSANAAQQLLVTRNNAYSVPESVVVADSGPAVFTSNGKAGIIVGVRPDQSQYIVDTAHPASAGDALVIYATGLGSVNATIVAGGVSPSNPLANTKNTVTVSINGKDANVFFAGLAPGFTSLYQVNVTVPTGLTPSADAPLVLTVLGQSSPVTTVAVK